MSIRRCRFRFIVLVLVAASFAGDERAVYALEAQAGALERECGEVAADVTGDVTAVLASLEPLDPSQPQVYGSRACGGFVFEYENPDRAPLRGAWIQASASEDVIDAGRCHGRVLEADYWGYEKREWIKLGSASSAAGFEPSTQSSDGYCRLEALIEFAGVYSKLRVVARVTDGFETYPMYACVW